LSENSGGFAPLNGGGRSLHVTLDGRSLGKLKKGQEAVFAGIAVGRHRLELKSGGQREVQPVLVRSAGTVVVFDRQAPGRERDDEGRRAHAQL
jgi:hypothetical protein